MNEAMKDLMMILPGFVVGGVGMFIAWRHIGGWRGFRTPRILIPLMVALLGLALTIVAASLEWEKVPGVAWVPNPAWMDVVIFTGLGIFVVGFSVATMWSALRFVQLHRVMERIDDYVQGSEPLAIPRENPVVLRDLALAAQLVADPALSHSMDPLVVERVGDLNAGRSARPLPAPRG